MVDIVYKPLIDSKKDDVESTTTKYDIARLCLLYGKLIHDKANNGDTAGDTDIYVIPDGKVFLLLSGWCSIDNLDTTNAWGRLQVRNASTSPSTNRTLIQVTITGVGTMVESINPSIPLLFRAGQIMSVYNIDNGAETDAGIVGYEIDAAVFFNNI